MSNNLSRRLLKPFYAPLRSWLSGIFARAEINSVLLGQGLARAIKYGPDLEDLTEAEFKVFSQFGEDGIIQYLISRVPVERELFVEFGVEDYRESNTRFLLTVGKWGGLVIDGSERNVESIRRSSMFQTWRLKATAAFVTRENINDLIRAANIEGDIGILSVDIDGNDYWVWEAIEVVRPRIVITEINPHFGAEHAVTIPYRPDFNYALAHHSLLYHGASLRALCMLAGRKGYDLVCCTSEGANAFFVRKDVSGRLRKLDAGSGFAQIKNEKFPYHSAADRLRVIQHLEVFDVAAGKTCLIRDLTH